MSIQLSYGGTIAREKALSEAASKLAIRHAFENSAEPGIYLDVSEKNARENANPLSKDEIGVFGEVEIETLNASEWDFDVQNSQGAIALALLKMKDVLQDIDFGTANRKGKFADPNDYRKDVWLREIIDDEDGLSVFFVHPEIQTRPFPSNGFFINVEEDFNKSGPKLTIAQPHSMPKDDPVMIESLVTSILEVIREQEPEAYNAALAEVMEEVSEYGYPHADDMSFYYRGSAPLELLYTETRDTYNGKWEYEEPEV